MTEQVFLESLHQSMRESVQLQLALGRAPQRATLEQVQMLREARLNWLSSHPKCL